MTSRNRSGAGSQSPFPRQAAQLPPYLAGAHAVRLAGDDPWYRGVEAVPAVDLVRQPWDGTAAGLRQALAEVRPGGVTLKRFFNSEEVQAQLRGSAALRKGSPIRERVGTLFGIDPNGMIFRAERRDLGYLLLLSEARWSQTAAERLEAGRPAGEMTNDEVVNSLVEVVAQSRSRAAEVATDGPTLP